MNLPGGDGQPFSYSAAVLDDAAVRVIFGRGSLAQVPSEARTLGSRIMIISGRHEAEAAEAVRAELGDDVVARISGCGSARAGRRRSKGHRRGTRC